MARGNYTPSQIKEMSEEEIYFIDHYQSEHEKGVTDTLGKMLGVIWDIEETKDNASKNSDDFNSDRIVFPLAMTINPKIIDIVKKQKTSKETSKWIADGSYIPQANEKVMSMGDISKEEFYKMIGKPIPSKMGEGAKSPYGQFGHQA